MNLTRRSFMGSAIVVTALAIVPPIFKQAYTKRWLGNYPTLYGDNVHDDTVALQALIDGKPVISASGEFLYQTRGSEVLIPNGMFKITKPLVIDLESKVNFTGCYFGCSLKEKFE
jgi:hypothetical protein